VIKKTLGRTTLSFRMIPTGWTRDWNRFLGRIRNSALVLDLINLPAEAIMKTLQTLLIP
jgi:hypothetical protein